MIGEKVTDNSHVSVNNADTAVTSGAAVARSVQRQTTAGRQGFDSRQVKIFFSSPRSPNRLWGQPPSYPMGTVASFPGIKVDRA
jgi:hypothetical protein